MAASEMAGGVESLEQVLKALAEAQEKVTVVNCDQCDQLVALIFKDFQGDGNCWSGLDTDIVCRDCLSKPRYPRVKVIKHP